MKLIFTLIILFSIATINAAGYNDSLPAVKLPSENNPDKLKSSSTSVFLRCSQTNISPDPLLVIDGVPYELKQLKGLDPNNIVSIDILKEAAGAALYGNRPARGLIIITTKTFYLKKFIIRDFLTGEIIPNATISFASKTDIIRTVANDSGVLVTDKLKPGLQYDITVSSAGYKTLSTIVIGKQQEVLLEKDIKICSEVIITAYPNIRRTGCCCCGLCEKKGKTIDSGVEKIFVVKSVYPNPFQRNNVFNLEVENSKDEIMRLSITSLTGSVVSLQSEKINKGLDHFSITADAKWAAGMYIIQLRNEKGTVIKQEKLIVQ